MIGHFYFWKPEIRIHSMINFKELKLGKNRCKVLSMYQFYKVFLNTKISF